MIVVILVITIFGILKLIEKIRSPKNEEIWIRQNSRQEEVYHSPKDLTYSDGFVNVGGKESVGNDLQLSTQSLMRVQGQDLNSNLRNVQSYSNLTTGLFET